MPINKARMKEMQKRYGKEKGKEVYYAMEQKQKGKKRKK